jgi:uncharacterized membrane protein
LLSTPNMPRPKGRTVALSLLVIILNNLGNLSLTWGMKHLGRTVALNPVDYVRAMFQPFVAAGVAMLVLWLLTRMALMSWADLSFVLPVTAVGYVTGVALATVFLDETVSVQQWIGTLLIMAGAALAGSAPAKTEPGGGP